MMQTHKLLSLVGFSFILVFTSCTMEKRVYMPGYYVDWNHQKHNHDKKNIVVNKNGKKTEKNTITTIELLENKTNTPTPTQPLNNNNIMASIDNTIIPITSLPIEISKKERTNIKYQHLDSKIKNNKEGSIDDCDIIVLLSGEKIQAKVIEIGEERIKYKLCDNLDGPTISINKSEVSLITHPDGTEDIITADDPNTPYQDYANRKTPGLTVIGFIASIISFFVFGIILGALAIVFGCVSLAKIKREPKKYKGRGLAIASIVLGVISIIALIVILSLTL